MNAVAALIGLAAAGLAAVIALELRPADPAPGEAAPPRTAGAPVPALDPFAGGRTAVLDTLLGRPLFSQTRRPVDAAAPAASAGGPAQPLPRMTGILIDGPRRSAIFASAAGRPVIVAEGGRVGPFTVESIGPQQVVVRGPEGRRVVRTSFDPNLPAATPAPAVGLPSRAPQFPGIVLPGSAPIPGVPTGGEPPFIPPATPGAGVGYGAAR